MFVRLKPNLLVKRAGDQFFLFTMMGGGGAGGRARRRASGDCGERELVDNPMAEAVFPERPGAHVYGLFLHPANGRFGRIILQRFDDCLVAKRVVLLNAQDGYVSALLLLARLDEVVVHLAAGEQDERRLRRVRSGVGEYAFESL